jgi:DNA-binding GntR family transcriptional regulator
VSNPPRAARSLAATTYARLRADILAGRYEPGTRLSSRAVAADLDVGMSVVRESLTRLAEQGLVVAEPHLGFSVVRLDMDDVRDISALRILVEGAALRQAVEHADVEYEARVIASHHRLARTPHSHDGVVTDAWASAHAQFHGCLVSAAPSPRLRTLAGSLRETAELYRRWSGMARDVPHRDVAGEHRALLDAALDRDADRAVELLTAHIETTTTMLQAYVEDHRPDLVS